MGSGIERLQALGRVLIVSSVLEVRAAAAMFPGFEVIDVRWPFPSVSQGCSAASRLSHIPTFCWTWDHTQDLKRSHAN